MRFNIFFISLTLPIILLIGFLVSAEDQIENKLTISEIQENLSKMLPESIEIISIEPTDIEGYLDSLIRSKYL